MKRIVGILQILVVLALVVGATLFACRWTQPQPEDEASEGSPLSSQFTRQSRTSIEVMRPEVVETSIEIEVTGTIGYRTSIELVPQVGGRVVWVSPSLRAGGQFEKDEILFRLDKVDTTLAVRQARADLNSALAEMNLTEAERDVAIQNYRLLNGDKDVPPLVAKEPQLERSRAAIERATARLLSAELDSSRTEFQLPFSGRVINSTVAVGQLVRVGQSVGRVYDLREIEAVFPISTADLDSLEPVIGREIELQIGANGLRGSVERKSSELDSRTRTSVLFAELDSVPDTLIPGQFVQATVFGPHLSRAFILAEESEQANQSVWLVRDDKLVRKSIDILNRRPDGLLVEAFEIHQGIVRGALPNASEGDLIYITNADKT